MVGKGKLNAAVERFHRQWGMGIEDDSAIAFVSEGGVALAEGVYEAGLAVDVQSNLPLLEVVGVDTDSRAAFGFDGEVAGLSPLECFYNFTDAWSGNGRFQNQLPQF